MTKRSKPHEAEDAALLTPQLQAALRRELSPGADQRKRVRAAVSTALAGAPASLAVKQADAAMAARATQTKVASLFAAKSLATKLVIASVMVAAGAVVMDIELHHGSASSDGRPAPRRPPVAAATLPRSEAASVPPAPNAVPPEPQRWAAEAPQPQPSAAAASERVFHQRPRRTPATSSVSEHSQPSAATPARQPEPAAIPEPTNTPAPTAAPATVAAPRLDLGSELTLVRAASAALDRHDAETALKLVARHSAEYPNGALQTEAEALRALALCAAGRRPEGERARDAFVRARPNSALAQRVGSACR
jgi:hypothetical protein